MIHRIYKTMDIHCLYRQGRGVEDNIGMLDHETYAIPFTAHKDSLQGHAARESAPNTPTRPS